MLFVFAIGTTTMESFVALRRDACYDRGMTLWLVYFLNDEGLLIAQKSEECYYYYFILFCLTRPWGLFIGPRFRFILFFESKSVLGGGGVELLKSHEPQKMMGFTLSRGASCANKLRL